jgi:molybdate transport system permease protein
VSTIDAAWLTVQVAAVATALATLVAVPAAWVLRDRRGVGKTVGESVILLPLVMPPTVVGLGLVYLLGSRGPFGWIGLPLVFTQAGAVIAAATVALPLIYLPTRAALRSVDADLVDAALILGADRRSVLWHVFLPLASRGIVAGIVLGAARAAGEFGATLMVFGWQPGRQTLPIAIYASFERGNLTAAVGPAAVLAVVAVVLMLLYNRLDPRDL